jgi:hypothetical protein
MEGRLFAWREIDGNRTVAPFIRQAMNVSPKAEACIHWLIRFQGDMSPQSIAFVWPLFNMSIYSARTEALLPYFFTWGGNKIR